MIVKVFTSLVERLSMTATITLFVACIIIGIVLGVGFSPPGKTAIRTSFFVTQILDLPIKPQTWFADTPVREKVMYPGPNGELVSDVYSLTGHEPRPGILLFLGANAAGRDDPDVIRLGEALARAGFIVMFHWSQSMGGQNELDSGEIENLVWAFRYLVSQSTVVASKTGIGGFSVGGSFALIAASDARIRDDIAFVNSFGGYFDAHDLFLQIATRSIIDKDTQTDWKVDPLTLRVFSNEMIGSLTNNYEKELLTDLYDGRVIIESKELAKLSPKAIRVKELIDGTSLESANAIMADLPREVLIDLDKISPSNHVHKIKTEILVIHDVADLLIPVSESRKLAASFVANDKFHYTETDLFDHVRPTKDRNWRKTLIGGFKVYKHMYRIIKFAM